MSVIEEVIYCYVLVFARGNFLYCVRWFVLIPQYSDCYHLDRC